MSDKEQALEQQLKELQEANINLRFDSVEKELKDIKGLLERSIQTAEDANKIALKQITDVSARVASLEEKNRNCPITTYRVELKRFGAETKFLRYFFSKPLIGISILTGWIILVFILLAAYGPEAITKVITLFK